MMFKTLIKNPMTIWLRWFVSKYYLEWKFADKKLSIGYMAKFSDCTFGMFNTIYGEVILDKTDLGDYSFIAPKSRLSNVEVGKFCSIGSEVIIGLGKHPSRDFVSTHPIFYSPVGQAQITFSGESFFDESSPIKIGHDVWIGTRALVLDGVKVGNGAIIGAGAVVVKDVPPYAIVGGVPAKVLRYRFESAKIEFLEQMKWWDKDINWIREHAEQFYHIDYLMKASLLF